MHSERKTYLKTGMLVGCVWGKTANDKCVFVIRSMASRFFVNCTFEQQTENQFIFSFACLLFLRPEVHFLPMILQLLLLFHRSSFDSLSRKKCCLTAMEIAKKKEKRRQQETSNAMHYAIEFQLSSLECNCMRSRIWKN